MKTPPHDAEAERAILGAILVDSETCLNTVIESGITRDDFYTRMNGIIFQAMTEIYPGNIDIITLRDNLSSFIQDNTIKLEYLMDLINPSSDTGWTTYGVEQYCEILKKLSYKRKIYYSVHSLIESIDSDKYEEELEKTKSILLNSNHHKSKGLHHIQEGVHKVFDALEKNQEGGLSAGNYIKTGFHDFDHKTGGLYPGCITIVAGRPGMGKSTFTLNIGLNVAKTRPVLYCTWEIPELFLVSKTVSILGRISSNQLNKGPVGDIMDKIHNGCKMAFKRKFYYSDIPGTVEDIHSQAREIMKRENDLGMVIIDRLEIIVDNQKSNENRVQYLSGISKKLNLMARDLDVPVILMVQLSRECDKRGEHKPMLSDLRDCGALEQDAKMVLFIYRDDYYNGGCTALAEIIIAKNNFGPTGSFETSFQKDIPSFENIVRKDMRNYIDCEVM